MDREYLWLCCRTGDAKTIKKLHKNFEIKREDIIVNNFSPLKYACKENHWEVIQYLYEIGILTVSDVYELNNDLPENKKEKLLIYTINYGK
jgi:hypothetical protein